MFCNRCGNQLADGARFCNRCGAPLQAMPPQPIPTQPPAQYAPPVQQPRQLYLSTEGTTLFNFKFTIRDAAGNVRYTAATVSEGLMTYNAKLYYPDQNVALSVQQQKKLTFSAMNFDLVAPNGALITEVIQKNKLTKYIYEMPQLGLTAEGDFTSHNFAYYRNGQQVAAVRMKWLTWGEAYEIEYSDPSLEQILLGTILVFEMVLSAHRHRRQRR